MVPVTLDETMAKPISHGPKTFVKPGLDQSANSKKLRHCQDINFYWGNHQKFLPKIVTKRLGNIKMMDG
jgi:hypothetical protein